MVLEGIQGVGGEVAKFVSHLTGGFNFVDSRFRRRCAMCAGHRALLEIAHAMEKFAIDAAIRHI